MYPNNHKTQEGKVMIRKSQIVSFALLLIIGIAAASPASAHSGPRCRTRHGSVSIQIYSDSTCPSAVGLCANVTLGSFEVEICQP
jgi:hypothetical protein